MNYHGYNVELGYTYGYYRELDPKWMDLCALQKGAFPPSIMYKENKLRYIEFGCGQGLNLCLIAACNPDMDFVGIDFNPQHIAHANHLANSSGLKNVTFIEADVMNLSKDFPKELGKFHYASAHGVLSWINKNVRTGLYKCLESALLPGSLVYLSYNTLPGWLTSVPIQHFLTLLKEKNSLSSKEAIDFGKQFLNDVISLENLALTSSLPKLKTKLESLNNMDYSYLSNEYLHDEWTPFWFSEIVEEITSFTKLNYLTTAIPSDWFINQILPKEYKSILDKYGKDQVLIESIIDLIINRGFRKDIFSKGIYRMWENSKINSLLNLNFYMINTINESDDFKFNTSLGVATGKTEIYKPLYDTLSKGPKTFGELLTEPILSIPPTERTFDSLLQSISFMLNEGHIHLHKKMKDTSKAKLLNRYIIKSSLDGAPYRYVVASNIPTVINVPDTDLMICGIYLSDSKLSIEEIKARFVNTLIRLRRGILKDGKIVSTKDELLSLSTDLVKEFLYKKLDVWKNLGVI